MNNAVIYRSFLKKKIEKIRDKKTSLRSVSRVYEGKRSGGEKIEKKKI